MASFGTIVVLTWMGYPLFGSFVPAMVLTVAYSWLRMVDTIVAQRGSLPNIYHCYYKAINCCKSRKLSGGDTIPAISAESADVLFSLKAMRDYETDFNPTIEKFKLHPSLDTNISTTYSGASEEAFHTARSETNPSNEVNLRRRRQPQASPDRQQETETESDNEEKNSLQGAVTSADETDPLHNQSRSRSLVMEEKVKSIVDLSKTSLLPMHPAFITIPCFNMDLSILVYNYFPLQAKGARLVATDLTILVSAQRGLGYNFETAISDVSRSSDSSCDIDVSLSTTIFVLVPIEDTEAPQEFVEAKRKEMRERAMGAQKGQTSVRTKTPRKSVPFAIITNTYRFLSAAQDVAQGPQLPLGPKGSPLNKELLKKACSLKMSQKDVAKSHATDVSSSVLQKFALTCGNIHPRHLVHPLFALFRNAKEDKDSTSGPQYDLNFAIRALFAEATNYHLESGGSYANSESGELNYPVRLVVSAIGEDGSLNEGLTNAASTKLTVELAKVASVDVKDSIWAKQEEMKQEIASKRRELESKADEVREKLNSSSDLSEKHELMEEAGQLVHSLVPKGETLSNSVLPAHSQSFAIKNGNHLFAKGVLFLSEKDSSQ